MLYVSTKFSYTSQVECKLQQTTVQVTIQHNTSYNRAQYKLQQSAVQVTIEHNTSYNRAQYKLQQSTLQVSCTYTVNGGAQIVCRQRLDTCYNGERLIEQPWSKCLWGLLHMRHVILWSCEQRHLLRNNHTTYCNGGTWWRSWLRHCATSWKVAGSIPDGVIGFFSLT